MSTCESREPKHAKPPLSGGGDGKRSAAQGGCRELAELKPGGGAVRASAALLPAGARGRTRGRGLAWPGVSRGARPSRRASAGTWIWHPTPHPASLSPKAHPCPVEHVTGTRGASAPPAKPCGSEAGGLAGSDHAPGRLVMARVPRCQRRRVCVWCGGGGRDRQVGSDPSQNPWSLSAGGTPLKKTLP